LAAFDFQNMRAHEFKEGTWSTQVVGALAAARKGIPVRSRAMPGNTPDTGTVEKVSTGLRD
jgi:hypothetical protein